MPKFKVLKTFMLGAHQARVGTIVQMGTPQGEEWVKSGHVSKIVSEAEVAAQKAKDQEAIQLKAEAKAKEDAEAKAKLDAEYKAKKEAEAAEAEKTRLAAMNNHQ